MHSTTRWAREQDPLIHSKGPMALDFFFPFVQMELLLD